MNKKTQIAILIATLTMQAQSMVDIKPITVKFDDFKTEYPFFRFKEPKRYSNDECSIGKIYLKNNLTANLVVTVVLHAISKTATTVS